jgi:1-pyrroline-5-carboxylate dehydrogenase
MTTKPYKCEALSDFSQQKHNVAFEQALLLAREDLGRTHPVKIGDEQLNTSHKITSINPANHREVIGYIHMADIDEIEKAISVAKNAFLSWKEVPIIERSKILIKGAQIMRNRKFYLAALMTLEAGKTRAEADADVAEAIDFLEYYGRQIIRINLLTKEVLSIPKVENNTYRYIPLGVGAIIAPWNFPLAILTGMTSSAIVTGNTVIVKPAATTGVIAHAFFDIMKEAGLPAGVFNLTPGSGKTIGKYLVGHRDISFISFTGSKNVGLEIAEQANTRNEHMLVMKRVVAEMGGKDAIVVSDKFDVNKAVNIVLRSAFGFSGQKCSAASRVFVQEKIYDDFVSELAKQTEQLIVGDPAKQDVFVGPLNDHNAYDKVVSYIEVGKKEGRLIAGGNHDNTVGYFVHPTVFADVDGNARIMQEEIFGPILAVGKFNSLEEGIALANGTEYGLTGAFLSNDKKEIEYAKANFYVGNLYINRKCTGAVVGYQPFGGFKMSGTNAKAGGPDHLLLFLQGQTISEALK